MKNMYNFPKKLWNKKNKNMKFVKQTFKQNIIFITHENLNMKWNEMNKTLVQNQILN
jgi:hypothetical protein